jgi:hypothetical protein
MKLSEIKSGLIETYFTDGSIGVPQDELDAVFESLGRTIGLDLNSERLTTLFQASNQSSDPSKAFKRFTEGRLAILTIVEEDGTNANAIFAAVRSGTQVKISDLTITPIAEKAGGLLAVKNALRSAKKRNDDVFFNITISDAQ